MHYHRIVLAAACLLLVALGSPFHLLACDDNQSPPKLTNWYTDLDDAGAESKRTGKPILMEINGRPWHPPCNIQAESIIDTADFQAWVREKFVLLDVKVGKGYDKSKGNPVWSQQMEQHKISGIPATVLIAPDGETMGVVFPQDNVQQWIGAANNVITTHALKVRDSAQTQPSRVIPFRLTKSNNISIPATLNNSIALNLMFHTAVDSVSLTKATTERYPELTLNQDVNLNSWGGQSKSRFGTGIPLRIAGLEPQHISVFEDLHSGHETDGKFGPEQLSSKLLAIDFDRSEIRLLSTLPSNLSEWQKLGFENDRGMMFITATVEGEDSSASHKFMIHSGYSGFALLDDSFAAQHPFLKELEVITHSELKDSAGNKLETIKVRLPKFKIGETMFEDAPVSFFSGAIRGQKFSVLGGDLLKRFNLIFDFETQSLYMKNNKLSAVDYFQNG